LSFKQRAGVMEGALTVRGEEMAGEAVGPFRARLSLQRQR
jgi:hypothetical protein